MSNEPRPWILRPIGVPGILPFLAVPEAGATLGRDPSCTIALAKNQFPQVSSQHARITLVDGALEVTDLGSRNGTFVNGVKITERRLASGDVVQLGEHGPRFAAVRDAGLDETMDVAPARRAQPLAAMGESTITNLRSALGAADQQDVEEAVERSSRRTIGIAAVLSVVVLGAAAMGLYSLSESGKVETVALRELNAQLRAELTTAQGQIETQRDQFEDQRRAVIAERDSLAERISGIEKQSGSEGELEGRINDELTALRGQLDTANSRLELFDPVNLEKERLRDVAGVHSAVVLIEATTRFRDTATRKRLHVAKLADGREVANLEFEGNLVEQESTGSGFCVSKDGYILTNAHVVMPVDRRDQVDGPGGLKFDVETELNVVFTGTDVRYLAELIEVTRDEDEDLALIRIKPFDGMPVVTDLETDKPRPAAGTEVYLFGFPLGKLVLQEGDRVVASTFKGILSREVGEYLQIDASVHPGNSGGPVTDAKGRVVGIVSRVQNTPGGQLANAIGYVIPISHVDLIWPPGGKATAE
jgi:S1-C subfamily serine protease